MYIRRKWKSSPSKWCICLLSEELSLVRRKPGCVGCCISLLCSSGVTLSLTDYKHSDRNHLLLQDLKLTLNEGFEGIKFSNPENESKSQQWHSHESSKLHKLTPWNIRFSVCLQAFPKCWDWILEKHTAHGHLPSTSCLCSWNFPTFPQGLPD